MISKELVEKARKVWFAGPFGNACVVLGPGKAEGRVRIGDLDAGEQWDVALASLTRSGRDVEEPDYGFSWTIDVEFDLVYALFYESTDKGAET